MNRKEWAILFLPLLFVCLIDFFTKQWAIHLSQPLSLGIIQFSLHFNKGAMLGLFSDLPEFLRVVSVSTGGAFLLVIYALVQYLLPLKSLVLRNGLSIFMGGILGNVLDRLFKGVVTDFMAIGSSNNFWTPIFNIADIFQWLGVLLIIFIVVKEGDKLWLEKNQRTGNWIKPSFQLKYCLLLLSVGLSMCLISLVFSYTYLRMSLIEIVGTNPVVLNKFLTPFLVTFIIISFGFCIGLFAVGKIISHKMAGPIFAFEKYLTALVFARENKTTIRKFKLRNGDEFNELESIAQVIKLKLAPEVAEDSPIVNEK